MISAVLVFSSRGELIVSKFFKNNLKRSISDIFRIQVINNLDVRSPILTLGSTTFQHIRSNVHGDDLWLVSVTRSNINCGAVWEFLYKFDHMLELYGLNNEEFLKEEFMVCYELLDVMLGENGTPMDTDPATVIKKMSVKPSKETIENFAISVQNKNSTLPKIPKFLRRTSSFLNRESSNNSSGAFNMAGELPWRPKGISHKKNEIFLYVNEKISILVSKEGSILKSYVDGTIDLVTHLSGTPVCQFGLNDSLSVKNDDYGDSFDYIKNKKAIPKAAAGSVLLEDCKFHQCVSLEKFDKDRIIKFVPPDGSMELMKYHVRSNINLPFKVSPIVTYSSSGTAVEYRITLKSLFPSKLTAKNVTMKIPVPPETLDCKIDVSNGSCKFAPEEKAMLWTFNKYNGLTENTLSAVTITSKDAPRLNIQQWQKPPISLDFEIMMFSNSGLVVRYFTIKESERYKTVKWIRYVSKSGSYEIRY
ncbi:Mu homology domain (MHD) profile [Nakaseomyces glabratus]